jgi:hypothetical protein
MEAKILSEIKTIQERWTPIKKSQTPFKKAQVDSPASRIDVKQEKTVMSEQWRAVHGSKGSIPSVAKKRKGKKSCINNSI